jgi:hypothetical protein
VKACYFRKLTILDEFFCPIPRKFRALLQIQNSPSLDGLFVLQTAMFFKPLLYPQGYRSCRQDWRPARPGQ